MIHKAAETSEIMVPFLFRFATLIPESPCRLLRYDTQREVSQVLIDGKWIDSSDSSVSLMDGTRLTKVPSETTDDA